MFFLNILWVVISLIILIIISVLFVECCTALLSNQSQAENISKPRPRIAVLVPAHNEALGITVTLETLMPQLRPQDRLVVIADNCTDETASVSRKLGATVIERLDPQQRGKGYALDYGLRSIETDPPEVVVMLDADCHIHEGMIERIAALAMASGQPVQASYLLARPAQPNARDGISAFAFMVKNLVRPKGLAQMGLPCLLQGTGMAFPWSVISKVSLANSNIVEDIQLAVDLAIAGHPPLFCLDAKVTGILPQQEQAAKSQRIRWEHGHLQTLITQVPQLLKASISQKRLDLLAIALDLCVPPLSLLVLIWLVVMVCALSLGILGASWTPVIILAIAGLLLFVSIVSAWAKFGRTDLPMTALLAVPFYILWKIPIYLVFLLRPQREWVRTERQ
ncbi:MAG: glycosyltransferase family 2 protein [Calothrix sp. MO_192.B10]|nr:glycosyltransferase family 2 protein [Calothrix sp. MO_192.B10]